jgi:hypothetical protein
MPIVTVAQVVETDLAQVISRRLINLVGSGESAQPISPTRRHGVGQATETDLSQPITPHKSVAPVMESDIAQAMTPIKSTTVRLSGQSSLAVTGSSPEALPHPLSKELSGIVVQQNTIPTDDNDFVTARSWYWQQFSLPADYARGGTAIPPLTGIQVYVTVAQGYARYAALDFRLSVYKVGTGWIDLNSGVAVGARAESAGSNKDQGLWFDMYFEPVDIAPHLDQNRISNTQFRFAVRSRTPVDTTIDKVAEYVDPSRLLIDNFAIPITPTIAPGPLKEGERYPFEFNSKRYVIYVEPGSGTVHYGEQQGVTGVWFSVPNPVTLTGKMYLADGVTKFADVDESNDVAMRFRILGATADSGTDFLSNVYRSAVITKTPDGVDGGSPDFWLSKPNPSQFAVESLYFDVSNRGNPVVIDRMLLDPITPGIYANVYYSNDPIPGRDDASWEHLLWNRVPTTFECVRQQSHAFPHPITAKYIKVEFSQLQARYYSPGNFQKAITYKKYPKWVVDYYLALYGTDFQSNSAVNTVVYDALDLAYNYYLDDIKSSPNAPTTTQTATDVSALTTFLSSDTTASQIDPQTLARIQTSFRPFLDTPFAQGRAGFILKDYLSAPSFTNYSSESILEATADTSQVSSLDRTNLVLEKNFPVMSFYLTSRHSYRVSIGAFENDRAYFAGVRQIAFTREHYASKFDQDFYIESIGDNLNVESNDFYTDNNTWVIPGEIPDDLELAEAPPPPAPTVLSGAVILMSPNPVVGSTIVA